MCKFISVLLTVAVVVVLLGYLLYVPLPPEDFPQPIRLRLELAGFKSLDLTGIFAEALGFEYASFSRAMTSLLLPLLPSTVDDSVHSYDTEFNGVPVRVYEPLTKRPNARGVVYYHGGGYVLGGLDSFHSQVHRIAKELNAVAVSVDYRMAPDHLFPAAVDDSEATTQYFIEHAAEFGVDPNRVAVMGDSAGGNLATGVTLRLIRKQFTPMPKMQVLIYPWLQMLHFDLPSYQYNTDSPLVTKERAVDFTTWYLFGSHQYQQELLSNSHVSPEFRDAISHILDINHLPEDEISRGYQEKQFEDSGIWNAIKDKLQDPYLCPILAEEKDLQKMPLTYVSTCYYDILRDEQLMYVARLRKAGVQVILDQLRVCYHSWTLSHENSFSKEYSDLLATVNRNL